MTEIERILIERDGMTEEQAHSLLEIACEEVTNGMNPEQAVEEFFGLEPDYIFDVLPSIVFSSE